MSWTIGKKPPGGTPFKTYSESSMALVLIIFAGVLIPFVAGVNIYRTVHDFEMADPGFFLWIFVFTFISFLSILPAILYAPKRLHDPAILSLYNSGLLIHGYAFIPWDKITAVTQKPGEDGEYSTEGSFVITFDCPQNWRDLPRGLLNRSVKIRDKQVSFDFLQMFLASQFSSSLKSGGQSCDFADIELEIKQHCPRAKRAWS